MNNNIRIIAEGFTTPVALQNEIRTRFATSKTKEIKVEYNEEEHNYDIYAEGVWKGCYAETGEKLI